MSNDICKDNFSSDNSLWELGIIIEGAKKYGVEIDWSNTDVETKRIQFTIDSETETEEEMIKRARAFFTEMFEVYKIDLFGGE